MKRALAINQRAVVNRCPGATVHYITALQGPDDISLQPIWSTRKMCESTGKPDMAVRNLRNSRNQPPRRTGAGNRALQNSGNLLENRRVSAMALDKLEKLLTLFPAGVTMFDAEDLKAEILRETSKGGVRGELSAVRPGTKSLQPPTPNPAPMTLVVLHDSSRRTRQRRRLVVELRMPLAEAKSP